MSMGTQDIAGRLFVQLYTANALKGADLDRAQVRDISLVAWAAAKVHTAMENRGRDFGDFLLENLARDDYETAPASPEELKKRMASLTKALKDFPRG